MDRPGRDRLIAFVGASVVLHGALLLALREERVGNETDAPPAPVSVQLVATRPAPAPQPAPAAGPEPPPERPPEQAPPEPSPPRAEPPPPEPPEPREAPAEVTRREPVERRPAPAPLQQEPESEPEPEPEPPAAEPEVAAAPPETSPVQAPSRAEPTPTPPAVAAAPEPQAGPPAPAAAGPSPDEIELYVSLVRRRIAERKGYPSMARRRGMEGVVNLRLRIADDGSVAEVRATGAAARLFERAALDAVERAAPFPPPPDAFPDFEVAIRYQMTD